MGGQATVNQIVYSNSAGVPTTTYRSAGTKLVLYDSISAERLDFSIGIEPYNMFLRLQSPPMGSNSMAILPTAPQ